MWFFLLWFTTFFLVQCEDSSMVSDTLRNYSLVLCVDNTRVPANQSLVLYRDVPEYQAYHSLVIYRRKIKYQAYYPTVLYKGVTTRMPGLPFSGTIKRDTRMPG